MLRMVEVNSPLRYAALRQLWLEYRDGIEQLAERGAGCA
jgi:hypothetical protein